MIRIALKFAALSLYLSLSLSLFGCVIDSNGDDGGEEVLPGQEIEQILQDARACGPTDQCIAVDTYCCPRPINADSRVAVEEAHERLDLTETECLADCVSIEDLTAECFDGLCSFSPF